MERTAKLERDDWVFIMNLIVEEAIRKKEDKEVTNRLVRMYEDIYSQTIIYDFSSFD